MTVAAEKAHHVHETRGGGGEGEGGREEEGAGMGK